MSSIWRNRKFVTVIVDIIISGATLAAGKWLAPDLMDVALWAVGSFQAIAGVLIVEFTSQERGAQLAAFARSVEAAVREVRR